MLEQMVNSEVVYIAMAVVVAIGILVKLVVGATLRRLVRAAENMSKSTHDFMRLVRAKFEHACMVNDKVENIPIFVEKYIREYTIMGIRIRGWQRLEKILIVFSGVLTVVVAGVTYLVIENQELALQYAIVGTIIMILLIGVSQLTDERYKIETIEMYMVDYLENVYARRFAKDLEVPVREMMKEENEVEQDQVVQLKEEPIKEKEVYGGVGEDPTVVMDALKSEPLSTSMVEKLILDEVERRELRAKEKEAQEEMPNKVMIREILQEFLA